MPGLQKETWRKKYLGSSHCPWMDTTVAFLLLGAPWVRSEMGDSGLLLLMEKEIFLISKELLVPEAGTMLLEGSFLPNRLSPDPWPLLPHSILSLGAFLWLGRPWRTGLESGQSDRGTTRLFPHEFSLLLKQIQTACEPGSPGEPSACSKWSGRAQESFVCCPSAMPAPLYLGIINCD